MAELVPFPLARAARQPFLLESARVQVASVHLGIAKLQVSLPAAEVWFRESLGIEPPPPLREIEPSPVSCAWLAPREWLVTGGETDVEQVRMRCAETAGPHGLMTDLTHGRACFDLSGADARMALAAHCPLDLGDRAMPVGAAMRSLFADVAFFVSRRPDRNGEPCFRLIFDQTLSDYVERLLVLTIEGDIA